jgi:hypothetical protein
MTFLNRGVGVKLRAGTKTSPYDIAYVLILESLILFKRLSYLFSSLFSFLF